MSVCIFFDIDGVIVRECDVAYRGYAFILMMIDTPSFALGEKDIASVNVPKRYFDFAMAHRDEVKGKHPLVKVSMWKRMLGKAEDARDEKELVKLWYRYQQRIIEL